LRRMLRINGTKVTEEMKANGNDWNNTALASLGQHILA
jgi:hypothetical protein